MNLLLLLNAIYSHKNEFLMLNEFFLIIWVGFIGLTQIFKYVKNI